MSTIRIITPSDITNDDYKSLADDISDSIIFASKKAILSRSNPNLYKMPTDKNTIEHSFSHVLYDFSEQEINMAANHIERNMEGSLRKVAPKNIPFFNAIDFKKATSIATQLADLSPIFSISETKVESPQMELKGGNWPGFGRSSLTWRINGLHCIEETGPTSKGSDHVYMYGLSIDAFGNTFPTALLDLEGDWDNGNNASWPGGKTITSMNLDYGSGWPRPCTVILGLSTRSTGDLTAFINKIAEKAKEKIIAAAKDFAAAYAGAKIGALIGSGVGPWGTLIGAGIGAIVGLIVSYVFDKVWGEIKSWFSGNAKVFKKPVALTLDIPYHGSNFEGSLTTKNIHPGWADHGGEYRADIDAVLTWGSASMPSAISTYNGRMDIFKVNNETQIQDCSYNNENGWSGWKGIAGGLTSADAPIGLVATGSIVHLFVVGLDKKLYTYHKTTSKLGIRIPGQNWVPVLDHEFTIGTSISGVNRSGNLIDIFATGTDGQVWTAAKDSAPTNDWYGWWNLENGLFLPGSPVASISRAENLIDIFIVGLDGLVYSQGYDQQWSGWFSILDHQFIPGIGVTAISRKENHIDLFAIDIDGMPVTASWTPESGWIGWIRIMTDTQFSPGSTIAVACQSPEHMNIFVTGMDGKVYTAAKGPQTNNNWAGWWTIEGALFDDLTPIAAASLNLGALNIYLNGTDGNIWSAYYSSGNGWNWGMVQ